MDAAVPQPPSNLGSDTEALEMFPQSNQSSIAEATGVKALVAGGAWHFITRGIGFCSRRKALGPTRVTLVPYIRSAGDASNIDHRLLQCLNWCRIWEKTEKEEEDGEEEELLQLLLLLQYLLQIQRLRGEG